ncbi:MAG: lipopolysaccharide biosynthesis protein [Planctomycetaceae bacterium]|nr:lipopolysaccharide biosynthesis protein [Planctomycetaceae bacterium]
MSVVSQPAESCPAQPEPSRQLVDSLATSLVFLLFLTVGQKLIGFVRSIIVCRVLPPEELGTWAMLQTLVLTISPVVLLSIPACFGRYFAKYRQQGQLAAFIQQATIICGLSLSLGVLMLWGFQGPVSLWVLGENQCSSLIVYTTMALIPFAMFSFLSELLLALRHGRVASRANFISTVTFTIFSLGFLICFPPSALSMLSAFALSFAIPLVMFYRVYRQVIHDLPANEARLDWASTWGWMFPVILLFWFTDLLTNLFYTIDKYMIVNLYAATSQAVFADLGAYEAMHVLTGIFLTVTTWIGKTLLPYTAKEWEEGRIREVSLQTNMSIKLVGFVSLGAGLVMSTFAAPLCHLLFNGKYDSAAYLVPYLVYFYLGCGTTIVLMNFYWCAGIAAWSTGSLVLGLVANCVVNYLLIPDHGIEGATIGTICGMACQSIGLLLFAIWRGLKLDLGVISYLLASSLLVVDRTGVLSWCGFLIAGVGFTGIFSDEERQRLGRAYTALKDKLVRA